MSEKIVPDTESVSVAQAAIAWEMIERAGIISYLVSDVEMNRLEVLQKVANLHTKLTAAMYQGKSVTLDDVKIEAGK